MAYTAIIWDLDGTLVESLPGIAFSVNKALEENGFPPHTTAAIRSFIGDGSWMLIRRAIKEVDDAVIDQVNESFKTTYTEAWKTGTDIYAGILELLHNCKKADIQLAILSNKPHNFTTEIVHTLFAEIEFDLVMGQQEGISQKPAADGTLLCMEQLNLNRDNVLFIGDSTIDLQTAKNAGVACAAVSWGYHDLEMLKAEGADHFAHTVADLHSILFS